MNNILFVIVLIIIYRFLLPFGDEPDFHIRASSVVNGLQEWWTPIDFIRLSFLYDFFSRDLNYLSKCNKNDYKELDTKFNGNGIFKLNGSQVRYHKEPSYTYLKNKKICL